MAKQVMSVIAVLFVMFVLAQAIAPIVAFADSDYQPEAVDVDAKPGIWVCKSVKGCAVYNQQGYREKGNVWAMTGKVKGSRIWSIRYSTGVPHNVWSYKAWFTYVG